MLRVHQVSKRFGGATALNSVSFSFAPGQIYGLAGENGAGKSTLVKILSGVHAADAGEIEFKGKPYRPRTPGDAEAAGISVFHQEIPCCPNLSIAANVFLGPHLPGRKGFPDWTDLDRRCAQLFRDWLGTEIDPRRLMRHCSAAERQLALLVRALSRQAQLVILDEPTTALTPPEAARLFSVMRRLRSQGLTLLFVSHFLDELMELSDEIDVLRDGSVVGHLQQNEFEAAKLAGLIAGRALHRAARAARPQFGPAKFEVRALAIPGQFQNISFALGSGEILGITGLQGSGRSALARALFAAPPAVTGEILLNGAALQLRNPRDAINAGIGYVPEDRKSLGLFDDLDIGLNISLLRLGSLSQYGLLSRKRIGHFAEEMRQKLRIKMSNARARITTLSGGNQQKTLIARWLARQPEVLVMNEPTRGVDVGAKDEIWQLIRDQASAGRTFVIVSSDLEELIELAGRILVLKSGTIVAEFASEQSTKHQLIHAAATGTRLEN